MSVLLRWAPKRESEGQNYHRDNSLAKFAKIKLHAYIFFVIIKKNQGDMAKVRCSPAYQAGQQMAAITMLMLE